MERRFLEGGGQGIDRFRQRGFHFPAQRYRHPARVG
jgi:hypothetical protein